MPQGGDSSGEPSTKSCRIDPKYSRSHRCVQAIMDDNNFQQVLSSGIHAAMKDLPDPYTDHTSNVVIRDDDLKFWSDTIATLENPKKRNRVAVVGTPGIGKTTTSFFAIRLLLRMGKTVVYLYRTPDKSNHYIQMTPQRGNNNVAVDHFPETTASTDIPVLRNKETYYIVDSGQTKENCNPEGGVMGRVIIVASPDERHWGSGFPKKEPGRDPGMFRYFPPWTLPQLKASVAHIASLDIVPDHIERLFSLFGGIPRMVYDPDEEDENIRALKRKVHTLELSQLQKLLSGRVNIHVGFGQDQPKGGIILFRPDETYSEILLEAASDKVVDLIRETFMVAVWEDLAMYGSPIVWQLFESYVAESLQEAGDYMIRPCVGKSDSRYSHRSSTVNIGGCTSKVMKSDDCTAAVRDGRQDRVLYYSSNHHFHPLYDMIFKIGNVYYAFQVTIGKKHKATKAAEIQKVVDALGITNNNSGLELRLFYAVHERVFDDFVTDPTVPYSPPGVSAYHMKIGLRS